MAFRTLLSAFAVVAACLAQARATQQISPKGPRPTDPDVSKFVPATAKLIKQLRVDFDNNGAIETVLAYASDTEPPGITTGVRLLKYHASSGWAVAFEETDDVINGAGVSA